LIRGSNSLFRGMARDIAAVWDAAKAKTSAATRASVMAWRHLTKGARLPTLEPMTHTSPPNSPRVVDRLRAKLIAAFAPSRLEIIDESHLHAGHAHGHPQGESHFRVEIASLQFDGKNRVARQRLIHAVLAEELAGPVHALSLTALTPDEIAR